jgi:hypothetical protein
MATFRQQMDKKKIDLSKCPECGGEVRAFLRAIDEENAKKLPQYGLRLTMDGKIRKNFGKTVVFRAIDYLSRGYFVIEKYLCMGQPENEKWCGEEWTELDELKEMWAEKKQ